MIRPVTEEDAPAIAAIYNPFIEHTTVSFETSPLSDDEMRRRIAAIAAEYPYFVYEDEEGSVAGYCYAHAWKERPAYAKTLETTIYLAPGIHGKGVGRRLMELLTDECRRRGFLTLIACITAENDSSRRFHESLGFRLVSDFKGVGEKFGRRLDVVDYQLDL